MAYTKFDPRGDRGQEKPFVKRKFENKWIIGFQLFLIFAVVRFCMIFMGVGIPFIPLRIPILDDLLGKLSYMLK